MTFKYIQLGKFNSIMIYDSNYYNNITVKFIKNESPPYTCHRSFSPIYVYIIILLAIRYVL